MSLWLTGQTIRGIYGMESHSLGFYCKGFGHIHLKQTPKTDNYSCHESNQLNTETFFDICWILYMHDHDQHGENNP